MSLHYNQIREPEVSNLMYYIPNIGVIQHILATISRTIKHNSVWKSLQSTL